MHVIQNEAGFDEIDTVFCYFYFTSEDSLIMAKYQYKKEKTISDPFDYNISSVDKESRITQNDHSVLISYQEVHRSNFQKA
jgi:hypothetical protein